MNWREKRRADLDWLGILDPAMLIVRYGEVVPQDAARPCGQSPASLTAMIEAILDQEEAERKRMAEQAV
jgi:hypothetical protein